MGPDESFWPAHAHMCAHMHLRMHTRIHAHMHVHMHAPKHTCAQMYKRITHRYKGYEGMAAKRLKSFGSW